MAEAETERTAHAQAQGNYETASEQVLLLTREVDQLRRVVSERDRENQRLAGEIHSLRRTAGTSQAAQLIPDENRDIERIKEEMRLQKQRDDERRGAFTSSEMFTRDFFPSPDPDPDRDLQRIKKEMELQKQKDDERRRRAANP